jgi:hypothetical protein
MMAVAAFGMRKADMCIFQPDNLCLGVGNKKNTLYLVEYVTARPAVLG